MTVSPYLSLPQRTEEQARAERLEKAARMVVRDCPMTARLAAGGNPHDQKFITEAVRWRLEDLSDASVINKGEG